MCCGGQFVGALNVLCVQQPRQAEYLPIKKIWDQEGQDEDAAAATMNYVLTAVSMNNANKTLNGRPYLKFNTWTRRWEVLYTRNLYSETFQQQWQKSVIESAASGGGQTARSAAISGSTPAAQEQQVLPDVPAKQAKMEGKPKKAKTPPTVEERAAADAAKAATAAKKKLVDGQFNKAKSLKVRADGAQSSYVEPMSAVDLDPDWAWLKNEESQKDLRDAKIGLDSFKKESPFWACWARQQNFAAHAKQHFTADIIDAQLKELNQLEKLIERLEKEARRLTAMQNARMSVAA